MLTARASRMAPSPTLAITAKAKALRSQGIDVLSFSAGEPDFDTPDRIKEAAIRAIRTGQTKYTEAGGIPELRSAACTKLKRDNGLEYTPSQVVASVGAKHTLYNICAVLFERGDEVIIPAPYWVSYPEQVKLVDAEPVFVPTDEAKGFALDPDAVGRAVTARTKAIILNSPNNPTGAVFSQDALEAIRALALRRNLWVISDECYEALTYGQRFVSIASLGPEIKERTLVVNTLSKAYAMTGWRVGYAAGPASVIKAMADFQSQCTSNPTSIAQWAAVEALVGPQDDVAKMAGEFDRRRHATIEGLNRLPGVRCAMPQGAFYAFPNVSAIYAKRNKGAVIRNSSDLTAFLLDEARVAVVPGLDFGSDDHIRISYATSLEKIQEGIHRMGQALARLEG